MSNQCGEPGEIQILKVLQLGVNAGIQLNHYLILHKTAIGRKMCLSVKMKGQ